MKYLHLTRILSAEFPKLKFDEDTKDLDKIDGIIVNDTIMSVEEFLSSGIKNAKVKGDLNLSGRKEVTTLPEGLEVSGSLILTGTDISSLPKGLKVNESLSIMKTGITSLPDDLQVKGAILTEDPSKIKCSERLKKHLSTDILSLLKWGYKGLFS